MKQRFVDIVWQETLKGRPLGRYTHFVGGTTTQKDLRLATHFLVDKRLLIDGPEIAQFENGFADFLGVRHAVSFSVGRMALYAILKAWGVGLDSEVLLLGYTCLVVPSAIMALGARPVYVDIDPKTLGVDPTTLESRITPHTKVVIVQHTFGIPTEIAPIVQLAKKYGLAIIEDCAHAMGSTYEGRMLGTLGDAAFFSSEHSKSISTGQGGMAVTNDQSLGEKLREFQQTCHFPDKTYVCKVLLHFIAAGTLLRLPLSGVGRVLYYGARFLIGFPRPVLFQKQGGRRLDNPGERLSNAQAAIGLSQLQQLPDNIAHRFKIAEIYQDALTRAGWPTVFPIQTPKTRVVFLRYPVWVDDTRIVRRWKRLELEIGDWYNSPIYLCDRDCWNTVGYQAASCATAEDMTHHILNLPTHIGVTPAAARATIKEIIERCQGIQRRQ